MSGVAGFVCVLVGHRREHARTVFGPVICRRHCGALLA
jgi:hypothetical protein